MIAKFTQAQANKVLKMLSLDPLFPGVGGQPIPWFESYSEIRVR
jgi:ribonucleotide reductase beta subunit family protein with ferritin-like domain